MGGAVLTAGDVGRREAVIHVDVVGLCYLQVHDVGGVLQGRDGVFVAHLLQAGSVDLEKETGDRNIEIF